VTRGLEAIRHDLEGVDDALIAFLAVRAALVNEAWTIKAATGVERRDLAREEAEIQRLLALARDAELDETAVRAVLATIIGHDLRSRSKPEDR
jgi:chorismate mutase